MAQDALVKEALTDGMIRVGADLTQRLDARRWPVVASFWFFDADENRWKLIIASPRVTSDGPKEAYEAISRELIDLADYFIDLQSITVTSPETPLVQTLAKALSTGEGISGIRFSRNSINGRFIEDAYVYRVNALSPITTLSP